MRPNPLVEGWKRNADKALESDAKLTKYTDDPVAFALDAFGVALWDKQEDIARSIASGTKTACKSGHKIGKSTLIAIVAWWWAFTRPRARVIIISATDRQIRGIIWKELRRLRRMMKPGFELPRPAELPGIGVQWNDDGGREIIGFSAASPEKAAGYSGDQVLYLADEASGIKRELFDAVEGNLAGGGRIALFSNPTQSSGYFFDAFHSQRADWSLFTVSSTETPNARTGKDIIPGLARRDWCEGRAAAWGTASSRYQVRVVGNFPDQGDDSVVPRIHVQAAQDRYDETPWDETGPILLGLDVARFGDDESVLAFRHGSKFEDVIARQGLPADQVASLVVSECNQRRIVSRDIAAMGLSVPGRRVVVFVDATGVGGPVADILRADEDARQWMTVVDVVSAARAERDTEYANLRAELWFAYADLLKTSGAIPQDEELDLELGTPKYKYDAKNRQIVEPKDEIKKRLKRSPDRADAHVMTCMPVGTNTSEDWSSSVPNDQGGFRFQGQRGF